MSVPGLHENRVPYRRVGSRAPLAAGSKASYPGQGPCRIGRIVKRVVEGRMLMFYHLTILDDSGGELFVPVEKARAMGVRLLINSSEIPELLEHLKKPVRTADNWKQRANDHLKLFTTGSAFDLAEVVASLTERRSTKSLTLREFRTLERARKLLVCEISEVMGATKTAAGDQVDQALKEWDCD